MRTAIFSVGVSRCHLVPLPATDRLFTATQKITQLRRIIEAKLGLDGQGYSAWSKMYAIEEALEQFEDMRVSGKEPSILKEIKRSARAADIDRMKKQLVK